MTLWLVCPHPIRSKRGALKASWREKINVSLEPCRTITTTSVGMTNDYYLEDDGMPPLNRGREKPPWRVPELEEVNVLPWNGLTVASTFSGCGGSCLGYRMAGFRVLWANEFVPSAQESYLLNKHPDHGTLDRRDVKLVKPEEVLEACGLKKGELDVFDGSPPCQAFSMAGKRQKGWGQDKKYEGGGSQKNEDMFIEWLRLLKGLMPRTFMAENVAGLVRGTCKGKFIQILKEMKATGYRVTCRLLDAQWLGVPQRRVRAFFVGVRNDLGVDPIHPRPLPWNFSVADACPWLVGGQSVQELGFEGEKERVSNFKEPHPTISCTGAGATSRDKVIVGVASNSSHRPTVRGLNEPCGTICSTGPNDESGTLVYKLSSSDTRRDRRMQMEINPEDIAPSITGGNPGNDVILNQPGTERRKFTIAEVKRLCAFPDGFRLAGSYAQQWERLGNSVPPTMMFWQARELRELLLRLDRKESWLHDPPCLLTMLKK